jgi:hypothetical protein
MAIIATETIQYCPQFNIESGNYEDTSPFVRNQRGGQIHMCPCRHSNKGFHNYSGWKTHINNDFHKIYISNYTKIVEQEKMGLRAKVEQLEKENSQLKLQNEKLCRANLRLTELHDQAERSGRSNRFERKSISLQSKSTID